MLVENPSPEVITKLFDLRRDELDRVLEAALGRDPELRRIVTMFEADGLKLHYAVRLDGVPVLMSEEAQKRLQGAQSGIEVGLGLSVSGSPTFDAST